jgi:glyceraldehyde-3-phosphate dehydrogenase/erythrose-4-phosphate dehydrogenase
MAVRVAINGFGRIGRNVLRAICCASIASMAVSRIR